MPRLFGALARIVCAKRIALWWLLVLRTTMPSFELVVIVPTLYSPAGSVLSPMTKSNGTFALTIWLCDCALDKRAVINARAITETNIVAAFRAWFFIFLLLARSGQMVARGATGDLFFVKVALAQLRSLDRSASPLIFQIFRSVSSSLTFLESCRTLVLSACQSQADGLPASS